MTIISSALADHCSSNQLEPLSAAVHKAIDFIELSEARSASSCTSMHNRIMHAQAVIKLHSQCSHGPERSRILKEFMNERALHLSRFRKWC